ncbi:MAG: proline--tRNA ligase [Candidatus Woesearchaeota archaeon]
MPEKKENDLGINVTKEEDFSEWFTQIVQKAQLADTRYNLKGFPVYREWATISMKKMYRIFEEVLERKGHLPLTFPVLIPESLLRTESEHIEGFTPEVFWVTEHGAGEHFEEKMALRPTSETAFYSMYSLWIRSYKDLPFKRYQSCSVYRHETKMTRPFFRTREIYWIEAHNAFATEEEAKRQVIEDMETTYEVLHDKLAIPHIFFQRPEWDKFAGAVHTFASDALMGSGRVLQLPSTHLLGQKFSKPFNVKFIDEKGEEKYCYITCYGPAISRIYGAMIALHSDNKGLVLPWDVAPLHIIIVPIIFEGEKEKLLKKATELKTLLKNYSVKIDDREDYSAGYKFNDWELKGVPIRIEIGPKDLKNKSVTIFRRDTNKKSQIKELNLLEEIKKIEREFTKNLLKKTSSDFERNIINAENIEEIKKGLQENKIIRASFCSIDMEGVKCAEVVEKELGGFVRGVRVDKKETAKGCCVICGKKAKEVVYIAKTY